MPPAAISLIHYHDLSCTTAIIWKRLFASLPSGTDSPRGRSGDEVEDGAYNLTHARRHSNASFDHAKDFKTKFEASDPEPVFEEDLHGAAQSDAQAEETMIGRELDKESTSGSIGTDSSFEEGMAGEGEHKM